ncbi:DUF6980 family protein [Dactylosporangium sp. CA-092794]|uniref:DUF6980 family protein n=1 Tax=Dactylosporangium sp. CA-092794 TaxID=3239929 RepID=UPI003D9147E0
MRAQLDLSAVDDDEEEDPWDDPDVVVVYLPKFDEYGLPVRDGGASVIVIGFCPWCGARLPQSRRDAWFDEMERLGLDPWEDEVPEEYQSDAWWIKAAGAEGSAREFVEPEKVISPA